MTMKRVAPSGVRQVCCSAMQHLPRHYSTGGRVRQNDFSNWNSRGSLGNRMQLSNLELARAMGCVPRVFKEEVMSVQKQEVFNPNWQEVLKSTTVNARLSKISDGPAKTMHYWGAWARSCSVEHLLGVIHEESEELDTAASQGSFPVCPSLWKVALSWQVSRLRQVPGEKEARTGFFSPTHVSLGLSSSTEVIDPLNFSSYSIALIS